MEEQEKSGNETLEEKVTELTMEVEKLKKDMEMQKLKMEIIGNILQVKNKTILQKVDNYLNEEIGIKGGGDDSGSGDG